MAGKTEEKLVSMASQVVEELGYELYHLDYRPGGPRALLRLYIDSESGIGLADCEAVSRRFGALMEVEDIIPGAFNLEVSSPGLDRPLFREKDYARFAGSRVRLTTFEPIEGNRHPVGKILTCTGGVLVIEVDTGQRIEIPFRSIASGRLEIELETAHRRGKR